MVSDSSTHGPWVPMALEELAERMAGTSRAWWIAGGHAIDLFLGTETRPHADIDVLVMRPDQSLVHEVLPGWKIYAVDPPGALRHWLRDEVLPGHVHDVWCRRDGSAPWSIQFMLDERHGRYWRSRRDPRITRPVDEIGLTSRGGLPFLTPEIQLFYKAANPRGKDEQDFSVTRPYMSATQCEWLRRALETSHGQHPWIARLAS